MTIMIILEFVFSHHFDLNSRKPYLNKYEINIYAHNNISNLIYDYK